MANTLNFYRTFTIEQFKANEKVDKIRVRKHNKLFIQYGDKTGAVSLSGIPKEAPVISLVNPDMNKKEPTAEELAYVGLGVSTIGADGKAHKVPNPKAGGWYYLLHEEGTGGAEEITSF